MLRVCKFLMVLTTFVALTAFRASAQSQPEATQSELMARIQELQQQLSALRAAIAPPQIAQQAQAAAPQQQRGAQAPAQTPAPAQQMPGMNMPAGATGGDPNNPEGAPADSTDPQALLDRIKLLEQRIKDLESSAVLSEPETRVKRKEVYVDANGVESD